jgi:transcriptional antiterminator RfaH
VLSTGLLAGVTVKKLKSALWDLGGEAVPKNGNMSSRLERSAVAGTLESQWFAIQTVAKHEKRVTKQLQEKDVDTFLPLLPEIHRWSDRQTKVDVPLFSCYTFVRIVPAPEERLPVLTTPGVLSFVGSQREGTPIPEREIENLKKAIKDQSSCELHPFITAGTRVRIRNGALAGVEGILVNQDKNRSLVVSVELLQRSLSVCIEGCDIEAI